MLAYLLREVAPPVALGLVAALCMVGWSGMDPTNIGWNANGDAATHYLGWWFFRNSPWHFPLGANPDYGLEIGSSVFYSDSIPLLAIGFKPFAAWLPTPFQYFGLWVCLCLVLQGWFAWRVLGALGETRPFDVRLAALGLFLFSPPLMIRVGGHSALVGHWLILAAFSLYLRPGPRVRRLAWPLLVLSAALVHSYLFVMVSAVWSADLLQRWKPGGARDVKGTLIDAAAVAGAALLGLWQAGFFLVRVSPEVGYGQFGMNLLAPFNPDLYSWLLPPVAPPFLGFHEGYDFAGLGALLLSASVLIPLLLRCSRLLAGIRGHWPLLLVLGALALFAVTNHVGLGRWSFTLPLPDALVRAAGTLRSSGRMYWPVHYALLIAVVLLVVRAYGQRAACVMLALATSVQVADSSRGWWNHLHTHFRGTRATSWLSPLKAPFWSAAGDEYHVLRCVPGGNSAAGYSAFAYYAASHRMATNAAYLARVDATASEDAEERVRQELAAGAFEPDTLYVLDGAHASQAAQTLDPGADLLTRADGYYVLAPGWLTRDHESPVEQQALTLRDIVPGLPLESEVRFDAGGTGVAYLGNGWSAPEAWGVWSDGPRAELSLPVDPRGRMELGLACEVGAFVPLDRSEQRVEVWINGVSSAVWQLEATPGWRELRVPPQALQPAGATLWLSVRFEIASPSSPKARGDSDDARQLGLALRRLKLTR